MTYAELKERMKRGDKVKLAKLAGVDPGRWWQWETGKREVSWDKSKAVSAAIQKMFKIKVRPEEIKEGWLKGGK